MCLRRYHDAMQLQQEGRVEEARDLYREILGSEVMDKVRGHKYGGMNIQWR